MLQTGAPKRSWDGGWCVLWARVAGKGFSGQADQMKRKGRLAGSWTREVQAEAEDLADTIKSYEGKRRCSVTRW